MSLPRHLLLPLVCAVAVTTLACGDPPDRELQQAQTAIDSARAAGASQYAREEFAAAEDALKRAHDAVDQRDYRLALNNALDARERAQNASKETSDRKIAARTDAERDLLDAMSTMNEANARLRAAEPPRTPARALAAARRAVSDSDGVLQKARAAFDAGDYPAVIELTRPVLQKLQAAMHDLEPAADGPAKRHR